MTLPFRAAGAPLNRIDGPLKVRGLARYAAEHPVDRPAYAYGVQATVAIGRITDIDTSAATNETGVLAVLTHHNAPRLAPTDDRNLALLQTDTVAYRGQFVSVVIAESPEIARAAAALVHVTYSQEAHDVQLRADDGNLYTPSQSFPLFAMENSRGDVDAAYNSAAVRMDSHYSTAPHFHNPIEPHSTTACWTGRKLTVFTSSQAVSRISRALADLFGIDPQHARVISPYVGGAFGSKVYPHPDVVLAAMASLHVAGRPVRLVLTRQQMFSQAGYRSPTLQRVRLGADADGHLLAFEHTAIEQTSKLLEVAEHCTKISQGIYAAENRHTSQRITRLDVPTPTIMRAPGVCPGMFALESAMDEMSIACGLDPIDFRIRNEPHAHPLSGLPFSSRRLVDCLVAGARQFGWEERDPTVRARRHEGWLAGTGVAAAAYPAVRLPGSAAHIRLDADGRYTVSIAAADMGTGTWTTLTQIAADALDVDVEHIELRVGDSDLPPASDAGASSGIGSWGSTILEAARQLQLRLKSEYGGAPPPGGLEVTAEMPDNPHERKFAMYSFGAHFAEVRVSEETGEVRVPRLLGVFAAGKIVNPKTARSQLVGGMVMGLSMALHEQGIVDPRFGHVVNQDLATYHISTNADVGSVEAYWLDEEDPYVNPMGTKGIGEIGIVGVAAAIANAVYHATGIRVRDLPITVEKLVC